MTDIVERLCKPLGASPDWRFIGKYQVYRSDEERVEAAKEIKQLRAALKPFADAAARFTPYAGEMEEKEVNAFFTLGQLRAAALALTSGERPE